MKEKNNLLKQKTYRNLTNNRIQQIPYTNN